MTIRNPTHVLNYIKPSLGGSAILRLSALTWHSSCDHTLPNLSSIIMYSIGKYVRFSATPRLAMVLNCGSSSVKYQLFENDESLVRGSIDNIGSPNCAHTSTLATKAELRSPDYPSAIQAAIDSVLSVRTNIACVGHRVVHGGPTLTKPTIITARTLDEIRECAKLAPLHNPSNIKGIELAQKALGALPQVACFDTAFHASIPQKAYRYAIPRTLAEANKIRRYGFHGFSYAYVSGAVKERRIIVAHLGSGCSAAAIVDGHSVDTTMGFTPMEGLIMSTRSGSIDPGVLLHLAKLGDSDVDKVSTILNKQSGLLGLSGLTMDMKKLLQLEKEGINGDAERAHEAVEVFIYSVQKHIGQLLAALDYDVEAIVFTGGIGENSAEIRERVTRNLLHFGVTIDPQLNRAPADGGLISSESSHVKVYAIKTNEEKQIAREAMAVI